VGCGGPRLHHRRHPLQQLRSVTPERGSCRVPQVIRRAAVATRGPATAGCVRRDSVVLPPQGPTKWRRPGRGRPRRHWNVHRIEQVDAVCRRSLGELRSGPQRHRPPRRGHAGPVGGRRQQPGAQVRDPSGQRRCARSPHSVSAHWPAPAEGRVRRIGPSSSKASTCTSTCAQPGTHPASRH
jgi:hypothetical protein